MLTFPVHLDSSLDLLELIEDQGVALIAVSVIISERLKRLGLLALADKPTRGLGNEPDQEELQKGWDGLEEGRDTPRPTAVDTRCTESRPRSTKHSTPKSAG